MKKLISILTALAILGSMTACSKTQTAETQTETETVSQEITVSGTVTAVDGDKITLADEDGTTYTFTVTEDTQYTMQMADGQQGGTAPEMPSGEQGIGDGTAPEMPSGEQGSGDGTAPEMPSGEQGSGDGTAPEMPSGEQGSGDGTAPEMPSGEQGNGDGTAPEMPSGEQGSGDGTAPEMPSGEQGGGNGTAPEMPGGEQGSGDGTVPEMPDGEMSQSGDMAQGGEMQLGADMLTVGTELTVTISADGTAETVEIRMNGGFGGGTAGSADITYTALNTYSEDTALTGESISSTGTDENAVLVTAGEVSLADSTIDRTSSDSTGGDNSSFYGVGAALLTTGGTLTVSDSTITTDAAGGAGVFAYGDGVAYVSNTKITTEQGTSGGIHVAGGGTLYAWDLDVETNGESSAAIRSDRGSGTMVVDGGTYTSNGIGSPAIYSTADITVNNADLTATASEAICIEGKNSIRLYDCNLSGNMSDDSRNDCTWNVILYQSMSGDSDEGNSTFEMVGGTLTAENGGVFYTTNTESTFILSGVDIVTGEDSEFFLKCTGNSNQRGWGTTGANGAQCTFTAIGQKMTGDIIWDSISTLDFYMTEGSTLTGAFLNDESNAGEGGSGYASLTLAAGCTWIVTENSTLTTLASAGSILDAEGKTVSVVGTDGTVYVSGDSNVTVTVESYTETTDLSGCSSVSQFSDFAVEKK